MGFIIYPDNSYDLFFPHKYQFKNIKDSFYHFSFTNSLVFMNILFCENYVKSPQSIVSDFSSNKKSKKQSASGIILFFPLCMEDYLWQDSRRTKLKNIVISMFLTVAVITG